MNYIYIFISLYLYYIYNKTKKPNLFSGTKEKNIAKRNKITARYLKIVNTVKKTTCNKYWGIFVILFSDIFDQIQYSEANNPKTRYCELWCKNYNMFVQKNTPCWENNNND